MLISPWKLEYGKTLKPFPLLNLSSFGTLDLFSFSSFGSFQRRDRENPNWKWQLLSPVNDRPIRWQMVKWMDNSIYQRLQLWWFLVTFQISTFISHGEMMILKAQGWECLSTAFLPDGSIYEANRQICVKHRERGPTHAQWKTYNGGRPTPHTHTEEGALNTVILTQLQGSRALRSFLMGRVFAQKERGPANSGGPTKEECIIVAERRHAKRRRCLKSCYA